MTLLDNIYHLTKPIIGRRVRIDSYVLPRYVGQEGVIKDINVSSGQAHIAIADNEHWQDNDTIPVSFHRLTLLEDDRPDWNSEPSRI